MSKRRILFASTHSHLVGVRRLEDFFQKYSSAPDKDSLTKADISRGLRGQRLLADIVGSFATYAECQLRVDLVLHL